MDIQLIHQRHWIWPISPIKLHGTIWKENPPKPLRFLEKPTHLSKQAWKIILILLKISQISENPRNFGGLPWLSHGFSMDLPNFPWLSHGFHVRDVFFRACRAPWRRSTCCWPRRWPRCRRCSSSSRTIGTGETTLGKTVAFLGIPMGLWHDGMIYGIIYGTIMGLFGEWFLELLGYFGTVDIRGYEYWILGYCSGGFRTMDTFFGMLGFLSGSWDYDGNPW